MNFPTPHLKKMERGLFRCSLIENAILKLVIQIDIAGIESFSCIYKKIDKGIVAHARLRTAGKTRPRRHCAIFLSFCTIAFYQLISPI
jgi:hypothetical protein